MYEKVLWVLKRARNENNQFQKEKNKIINERAKESYENAQICYICKEKFENEYFKDKKYRKVRDHCHFKG